MLQAGPWFTVSVAGARIKYIQYVLIAFFFPIPFLSY